MTDVKPHKPPKPCEHRSAIRVGHSMFGQDAVYWCSLCGAIERTNEHGTRYWTLPGVSR